MEYSVYKPDQPTKEFILRIAEDGSEEVLHAVECKEVELEEHMQEESRQERPNEESQEEPIEETPRQEEPSLGVGV